MLCFIIRLLYWFNRGIRWVLKLDINDGAAMGLAFGALIWFMATLALGTDGGWPWLAAILLPPFVFVVVVAVFVGIVSLWMWLDERYDAFTAWLEARYIACRDRTPPRE